MQLYHSDANKTKTEGFQWCLLTVTQKFDVSKGQAATVQSKDDGSAVSGASDMPGALQPNVDRGLERLNHHLEEGHLAS